MVISEKSETFWFLILYSGLYFCFSFWQLVGSFQESGLFPSIVRSVGGVSGQGSCFNAVTGDFFTFPSFVLRTPVIECLEQCLA